MKKAWAIDDELGIYGESLAKLVPGALGRVLQTLELGPGGLGVDVIARERRDPAPVVESRGEEPRISCRREIGGRLQIRARTQENASHGERRLEIVESGIRSAAHPDRRLRAEILNDDLLDVTVAIVLLADRQERVDPFFERLADADEDAGGER